MKFEIPKLLKLGFVDYINNNNSKTYLALFYVFVYFLFAIKNITKKNQAKEKKKPSNKSFDFILGERNISDFILTNNKQNQNHLFERKINKVILF